MTDADTHTEYLFAMERQLRQAAMAYAAEKNNGNAKELRLAAIAYAEATAEVDEAMEAKATKVTP